MSEEQITKAFLKWLESENWELVCFDFPQSGTGRMLHPNNSENHKNKDAIIPDIVVVRNEVALFFENKDRFYYSDFQKVDRLRNTDHYSDSIQSLLETYNVKKTYFGIGGPKERKFEKNAMEYTDMVDFIVMTDGKRCETIYDPFNSFVP